MKNIIKEYTGTVIAAVILVLTLIVSILIGESHDSALSALEAKNADLKSQIVLKQQTVANNEAQAVQAVTGLDKARTIKDDELAEALFEKIFSWSSHEEYTDIRSMLIEEYNLAAGSEFLTQFMPEMGLYYDSTGKAFNRIDVFGLNMSFEDMESYCTYIKGGEYSYAAFVEISSADNMGNTGFNKFMVTYTTDIDGNIFNLDAFAAD